MALREAKFGNSSEARRQAQGAAALSPSREAQIVNPIALAPAGDSPMNLPGAIHKTHW